MGEFELMDLLDSDNVIYLIKSKEYISGYFEDPESSDYIILYNICSQSGHFKYATVFDDFNMSLKSGNFEILSKKEFDDLILLEKIL